MSVTTIIIGLISCAGNTIQKPRPYYKVCWLDGGTSQFQKRKLNCLLSDGNTVQIDEGVSFVSLNESGTAVCYVKENDVFCVGVGSEDTKGLGFFDVVEKPVKVAQGLKEFFFGRRFGCGLTPDGKVLCFGKNAFGQVPGCSDFCSVTEVAPVPITQEVVKIDVGKWHVCALANDGTLYCWGRNWDGQVGIGKRTSGVSKPSTVLKDVSDFCTGGWHTCAVSGGEIFCWGESMNGQYDGRGGIRADILEPITTPVFSGKVDKIDCGQAHTCVLSQERVFCWGWAEKGQLGDVQEKFAKVELYGSAKDIWVEGDLTCVVDIQGKALCWGDGNRNPVEIQGNINLMALRRVFYIWDPF